MTIDPKDTALSETASLSERPAAHPSEQIRVGPYRLMQLLGQGGMGEVWAAEQVEPVHRKVALKVIKVGMDTKEVVARFEAERQALALMNHPAIAKVLEAGATPEGRPYFVMEYVPGVSITAHCDGRKLGTEERLRLFIEVCDGTQHAHQKAIIHRDLKPSNVLVALIDGGAQPKIIDFGIAKATGARLTERTLFTEVGSLIGTPEYMSPEQAELTGQGIDTRTDIYSLGVILYELLTGQLPFSSEELRPISREELLRRLRDVDPLPPSTRLAGLGGAAIQVALLRHTEPDALRHHLSGDLDAIVMKALEKDPARRYGTASELAADIERHLGHEPVLARPPRRLYRIGKYARRHRLLLFAAAAVLTSLLVGVVVATVALVHARRARAEEARQRSLAEARLHSAEKYAEALFLDIAPRLGQLEGAIDIRKRLNAEGAKFLDDLAVGAGDDPQLRWLTARMNFSLARLEGYNFTGASLGDYPAAIRHGERALSLLRSLPLDFPSRQLRRALEYRTEDTLQAALMSSQRSDEALVHTDRMRALALTFESEAERADLTREALRRRANNLQNLGRHDEAIEIYRAEVVQVDAELAASGPRSAKLLHLGVVTHLGLEALLGEQHDLLGAVHHLEIARGLSIQLVQQDPTVLRSSVDLGRLSISLGGMYLLVGRDKDGDRLVDEGLRRLEKLERSDPENRMVREVLAGALDELAGRAFAAAERPGVSSARRQGLLQRAIDAGMGCRQRRSEKEPGGPNCGGPSLEKARSLLAQERAPAP